MALGTSLPPTTALQLPGQPCHWALPVGQGHSSKLAGKVFASPPLSPIIFCAGCRTGCNMGMRSSSWWEFCYYILYFQHLTFGVKWNWLMVLSIPFLLKVYKTLSIQNKWRHNYFCWIILKKYSCFFWLNSATLSRLWGNIRHFIPLFKRTLRMKVSLDTFFNSSSQYLW